MVVQTYHGGDYVGLQFDEMKIWEYLRLLECYRRFVVILDRFAWYKACRWIVTSQYYTLCHMVYKSPSIVIVKNYRGAFLNGYYIRLLLPVTLLSI